MQYIYIKLRLALRKLISKTPLIDYYIGNYLVVFDLFIRKRFRVLNIDREGSIIHNGHKLNYGSDDLSLIEFLITNNDYEEPTRIAIENILKEGDVFLDLGSHIGFLTLIAARCVGASGKVYAFEPTINTFKKLKKNILENNYENIVTIENMAVTDKCEKLYLRLFGASSECNSIIYDIYDNKIISDNMQLIDAVSVDYYAILKNINKIDLVKMDIEGCEYRAIRGMESTIFKNKSLKIIFEFNKGVISKTGGDGMEIFNLLDLYGYKKYTILSRKNIIIKYPEDFKILQKIAKRDNVNILAERI